MHGVCDREDRDRAFALLEGHIERESKSFGGRGRKDYDRVRGLVPHMRKRLWKAPDQVEHTFRWLHFKRVSARLIHGHLSQTNFSLLWLLVLLSLLSDRCSETCFLRIRTSTGGLPSGDRNQAGDRGIGTESGRWVGPIFLLKPALA